MNEERYITGKKLLIVDDEKDVLDTLFDLLANCKIDAASSYEEAKGLLESEHYDLAILDIMGVDGYGLLDIANSRNVPAIMLTAHALSAENLKKSAKKGAAYYAPKEELANMKDIVEEVLGAIENKKSTWQKMFERLSHYYDRRFNGPQWREKEKEFWDKKRKHIFNSNYE